MSELLTIRPGVKSDPIEYRYSFEWLFRLMAEEGVEDLQLGSFFELYQLPDAYFVKLRKSAGDFGVRISSVFTAHRELGGFFRNDPDFEAVARRNCERLIDVGALVGAECVGWNPGAVLRDELASKDAGIARYFDHMERLLAFAYDRGVPWLTVEPMSCAAEPPALPDEIEAFGKALSTIHARNPRTAQVGFCADVSHGYADKDGNVLYDHMACFEASFPYLAEVHLRNTDEKFGSVFGFSEEERARGIVDVPAVKKVLESNSNRIPRGEITAYFEIGGPKLGRDYSDPQLEEALRTSLRYLRSVFEESGAVESESSAIEVQGGESLPITISPSLMCCDLCHVEACVRELEREGIDMLHLDIMDGRFVPNMPMGLEFLRQLRPRTTAKFDAHLMVEDNAFFVERMIEIGADRIAVHVESCADLPVMLDRIRDAGIEAGAAISPDTPVSAIGDAIDHLDYVIVMTVHPGFAGQRMAPGSMEKIAACRAFLDERGSAIPIQVDGNVSFENIVEMVAAGADNLVGGSSSVFRSGGSLKENVARTRDTAWEGLRRRMALRAGRQAIK